MINLYYIENCGCDDVTCGLAVITDEHFPAFKNIIKNLNKNSTYDCQPTIYVYKISMDDLREATEDDADYRRLYLGDKVYVIANEVEYQKMKKEVRVV